MIALKQPLINFNVKSFGNDYFSQVQTEVLSETTWRGQINKALKILNLPYDKEKDFCKAAVFIYNNLQAFLEHDVTNITLKGPLTIAVNNQRSFDDKIISKVYFNTLCFHFFFYANGFSFSDLQGHYDPENRRKRQ